MSTALFRRPPGRRSVLSVAFVSVLAANALSGSSRAADSMTVQDQAPARREFEVAAKKYVFSPDLIEVDQDDLVKITLHADDIAHSFTVDAYRIAKRAAGGQMVSFEFRADQAGTFPFYCNLTTDEGCREMNGKLVVRTKGR